MHTFYQKKKTPVFDRVVYDLANEQDISGVKLIFDLGDFIFSFSLII